MEPVLECKNICFSYHNLKGETRALSDISFQVKKGEFLAIVGPSGCGNAMVLFWKLWKLPLYKNTPVLIRHRDIQGYMSSFSIPQNFFYHFLRYFC